MCTDGEVHVLSSILAIQKFLYNKYIMTHDVIAILKKSRTISNNVFHVFWSYTVTIYMYAH